MFVAICNPRFQKSGHLVLRQQVRESQKGEISEVRLCGKQRERTARGISSATIRKPYWMRVYVQRSLFQPGRVGTILGSAGVLYMDGYRPVRSRICLSSGTQWSIKECHGCFRGCGVGEEAKRSCGCGEMGSGSSSIRGGGLQIEALLRNAPDSHGLGSDGNSNRRTNRDYKWEQKSHASLKYTEERALRGAAAE